MYAVEVNNVSKRFNDKLVLDNVSFKVKEGEIFGFIGPNGAGKSTLINIITNILAPDSGEIKVCGFDVMKDSLKSKACIGFVPQDLALIEDLNAKDNLEYFGALYGLKGVFIKGKNEGSTRGNGIS